MEPKWEVITFQRNGCDWFSVKNLQTGEVQVYSWDEWLVRVEYLSKEGLVHGKIKRS